MGTVASVSRDNRRDYGTGSVFQRADGMWIGRLEAGWNADGNRRRPQVSAKTEEECKRRLVKKKREIEQDGLPVAGVSDRTTVKTWADFWIEQRRSDLRPSTHGTYAGQLRKWVVPTIGKKRLSELTPGDLRAVSKAETDAGNAASSARQTRRALVKCLRDAILEGHKVPTRIFETSAPVVGTSDRADIPIEDALSILDAALTLPDRSRWVAGLLQGIRQNEALGLRWDDIYPDRGIAVIRWQLASLPYLDRPSGTFAIPAKLKIKHLWKSYHLVEVKTKKGERVIPLVAPMLAALEEWRAITPPSPYGLVWPRSDGKPRNPQHDTAEWVALQDAAQVAHVDGSTGRRYDGHEMRHTTATLLLEAGVDPEVIKAILGHSSIVTSRGYQHVSQELARGAMEKVADRLGLNRPAIVSDVHEPGEVA